MEVLYVPLAERLYLLINLLVLDWTMSRMAELLPGYSKAIIVYG